MQWQQCISTSNSTDRHLYRHFLSCSLNEYADLCKVVGLDGPDEKSSELYKGSSLDEGIRHLGWNILKGGL